MTAKKTRPSLKHEPAPILGGGKPIPERLIYQSMVNLKSKRNVELNRRQSTEGKMSSLFGRVRPTPALENPDATQIAALDGLLANHEKLANQKLSIPKVPGELGGLKFGQIVATAVPPFDFSLRIPTLLAGPNPALDGTADKNAGTMDLSASSSSQKGFGGGSMFTSLGVYFHPLGAGTLKLSAKPKFSFQWWTNSIGANSLVRSFGSVNLGIFGVDLANLSTGAIGGIKTSAAQAHVVWDENMTDQVRFDFGFDLEAPLSTQLDVTHDLVYMLFVDADVHVEGVGWPGSLAGAKLAVTVPSLTYEFNAQQVLHL